ncbi:MAG: YicC/YloC family endoribonuclease [Thermodesulfovibrionia bacterium]|nr:YicC/YloC family endoribonuclease [Thermodesulfovibrionia bacterium]
MQIESMTGFGSAEKGDFSVEVRSVNHKNLDIHFNAPSYLYRLDADIRKFAKDSFNRGRIDIYVSKLSGNDKKIHINTRLAQEYQKALLSLKKELKLKDDVGLSFYTTLRDIFSSDDPELNVSDFNSALHSALKKLKISRRKEGKALVADINKRTLTINKYLLRIESRRKKITTTAVSSLRDRLKDIMKDAHLDESRLIQEAAILTERSDITEEAVRIKSHLNYMKDIIKSGDTVGKKLDFVIQELRREVNTIGSKSSDIGITVSVVEMKDELEKIREQVQNLQ